MKWKNILDIEGNQNFELLKWRICSVKLDEGFTAIEKTFSVQKEKDLSDFTKEKDGGFWKESYLRERTTFFLWLKSC